MLSIILTATIIATIYTGGDSLKLTDNRGDCPFGTATVHVVPRETKLPRVGCWAREGNNVIILWNDKADFEEYPLKKVMMLSSV